MVNIIQSAEMELRPGGTAKFEGERYGSKASFFHVKDKPGGGPVLHVHPYAETWVVISGQVRLTVGDRQHETGAGYIVVAPADVPHKFVNIGEGVLEMVCIHPSPRVIQEDLE